MQAVAEKLNTQDVLAEKLRLKTARVGVVGLGYAGLPLAVEFGPRSTSSICSCSAARM